MGKYDDIINLPHHRSVTRRPMPMSGRAAQFSSFAALHGHDEALAETARLTIGRLELSGDEQKVLSGKMAVILKSVPVDVSIVHFKADGCKEGGSYRRTEGKILKYDEIEGVLILDNGRNVAVADIIAIDSTVLDGYDFD